ncbi:hypothetical protein FRC07_008232 [Ceratobasidium sp. 392]|nr:hypothetical protein FRC07_008232 [Ceratobasidium sp. 392]
MSEILLGGEGLLAYLLNIYRLLGLVQDADSEESGSKKIAIDQASLRGLLNGLLPGCDESISKIDLKALDKLNVKPLGLYGSKSEIIKFLQGVQCLSEQKYT